MTKLLNKNLNDNINALTSIIGKTNTSTQKSLYIGKNKKLDATIIYIEGFVNKEVISRDILMPLMTHTTDMSFENIDFCDYILKTYITSTNTYVEKDLYKIANSVKSGYTVLLINGVDEAIVCDTKGGDFRGVSEPENEAAIRSNREGFVDEIERNISILRRYIKDNNLSIEFLKVGARTQTDIALAYIDDIADKDILQEVKTRITAIDVDGVIDSGMLSQYIQDNSYSPFPQIYSTERPDKVVANILEGRIAIIMNRSSYVLTVPALFSEFFQAPDDYSERTINGSFARILRYLTAILILTLPSIYLSLIKFNIELIPVKLITPIIKARTGIYLTPFLEIMSMEIVVELLREGGLRLPPRVAATLSIVGGIIIGNTAIESKLVSPITLFVVGVTTISTFLIPNYEMSLTIRFIRFPMLILSNFLGFLGITAGWFILLMHLSDLKSFNVEYFSVLSKDLEDTFIRKDLWKMNERPQGIPNNNSERQKNFMGKIWRDKRDG